MSKLINTLIVFRIIRMLTTSFEDTDAFKLGIIDKNGNRIKSKKVDSQKEKDAFSLLHRLVFNLKRIIQKVPFGKSKFASYAVALALLKEHTKLTEDQANELCEDFYRTLKDNDWLDPEHLTEAVGVGELQVDKTYHLRRQLKEQNDKVYPEKIAVEVMSEHSIIFGVKLYVGNINGDRVLVSEDDVY